MHHLKSIDRVSLADGRLSLIVASPVSAERNHEALLAALGPRVDVDGVEYEPLGFEWHVPAYPVAVGEVIGIVVRRPEAES